MASTDGLLQVYLEGRVRVKADLQLGTKDASISADTVLNISYPHQKHSQTSKNKANGAHNDTADAGPLLAFGAGLWFRVFPQ